MKFFLGCSLFIAATIAVSLSDCEQACVNAATASASACGDLSGLLLLDFLTYAKCICGLLDSYWNNLKSCYTCSGDVDQDDVSEVKSYYCNYDAEYSGLFESLGDLLTAFDPFTSGLGDLGPSATGNPFSVATSLASLADSAASSISVVRSNANIASSTGGAGSSVSRTSSSENGSSSRASAETSDDASSSSSSELALRSSGSSTSTAIAAAYGVPGLFLAACMLL